MSVDAAQINRQLTGFSELHAFALTRDGVTYALRLTLANKHGATQTLLCRDVQNLELNPNASGFTRLAELHIEDVREDGLDRIHYTVEELADETLFLHCADLELMDSDAR